MRKFALLLTNLILIFSVTNMSYNFFNLPYDRGVELGIAVAILTMVMNLYDRGIKQDEAKSIKSDVQQKS